MTERGKRILLIIILVVAGYLFYDSPLFPKKTEFMIGPAEYESDVYYSKIGRKLSSGSPPVAGERGIRITGQLPLKDYIIILRMIEEYEPKVDVPMLIQKSGSIKLNPQFRPVWSKDIESIHVKGKNTVEVISRTPFQEGQAPQSDSVVFKKKWGKWSIESVGIGAYIY